MKKFTRLTVSLLYTKYPENEDVLKKITNDISLTIS